MINLFELAAPASADPLRTGKAHATREHDDYSTPVHYIERVREALGGIIACDPASSDADNDVVRAVTYYTHERSGLDPLAVWVTPVFLNPPSVRREDFVRRAADEASCGCEMVVVLQLKHLCAGYVQDLLRYVSAAHIPRGRPAFPHGSGERTESPTDGRAFLYVGRRAGRFVRSFGKDAAGWTFALTLVPQAKPLAGKAVIQCP